ACADGLIFLEDFSPLYKQASDFLNAIAEPFLRRRCLETKTIITDLNKLAKNKLPKDMVNFIHASIANYGKVLKRLLSDEVISRARVLNKGGDGFTFSRAIGETECTHDGLLNETQLAAATESKEFHSFDPTEINPDLEMELKPQAQPRPYQEESLSRMFGNGRARSGIIMLPCGAGKSLVGVSAACRIKKSCLCVATNAVSVDQWANQFKLWSNIPDERIAGLDLKSKKIIEEIRNREWGLLLMDEVHVVPTPMVCKVISVAKSHCKLGLTATLVREDKKITDLNVLIGLKQYEANQVDLVRGGYIENVQCAEVRCPMKKEFFTEYQKKENFEKKKQVSWSNERPLENKELNAVIGTLWRD
ncbi:DNA repair helicase XPB1, partial [Tanacetum coccineum]